jgi:transposase
MVTPAHLPDSIEELRALVLLQAKTHEEEKRQLESQHEQAITEYSEEIAQLREYIRLFKSQRFGSSSERSDSSQLGLFNEAEAESNANDGETSGDGDSEEQVGTVDIPAHSRKRRGGRKPLPDHLPRVEIVHDVAEHEKVCANNPEHHLTRIGEEKSERLVLKPAELYVEVHIRPKYACGSCKDGVKCEPPPPSPIPKSMASPSLLAQIVTSKFVDGMPLHRQQKMFARIGIDLPRATMASWMMRCAELAEPLTDLILESIRNGDHVLADETSFQVLKEKGKTAQSKSQLWALRGEDPAHPLLYYEYAPTRSGEVAQALLDGFKGFLQTDGYKGYDRFDEAPGVVHVGCFAHARRKFDEALRGQGRSKKKSKPGPKKRLAEQGLLRINKLYEIERGYKNASPEERYELRKEELAPRLADLREWIDASKDRAPPKSLTGKAIDYLDGQWPKLMRVLDDGRLQLDTNAVERAIRPFVIGRRGWLFADTPRGATASARLYTLVETAKANGVEPWAYLEKLFSLLPMATCRADHEALLPWRVELEPSGERLTQS